MSLVEIFAVECSRCGDACRFPAWLSAAEYAQGHAERCGRIVIRRDYLRAAPAARGRTVTA